MILREWKCIGPDGFYCDIMEDKAGLGVSFVYGSLEAGLALYGKDGKGTRMCWTRYVTYRRAPKNLAPERWWRGAGSLGSL